MTALPSGLLPDSAEIGSGGRLSVGGVDVLDLAAEHGTPLFVYDEDHIRARCREAVKAFGDGVSYATKAFLCQAMAAVAHDEGMYLDVATGGEMHVALSAGVPADRMIVHGNNKSETELRMALEHGVAMVVIDTFEEIDRIEALAGAGLPTARAMIRINPGVEAHTHEYLQTGVDDSKFGFGLHTGAADAAATRCLTSPAIDLIGIHAHIGSQVFETASFSKAVSVLAPFVNRLGLPDFSVGGGLGVAYVSGERAPTITEWAEAVSTACRDAGIEARVTAEPGRSIVAGAAVTLYTVGAIKSIPNVRTYVAVDGGMSDNPRPVLYGSGYEAFLPRVTNADRPLRARIVGKHCESGDVLVHDAALPADLVVGDIVATPVTGAYGHTMGSNYNMALRPPVVFVSEGNARVVVRRETFDDLTARDV